MTASQLPASPPRARLTLTAIVLTCLLVVYVVIAPLALRGGATGWLPVAVVADIVAVAVVAALFQMRRVTAEAHSRAEDAREELARMSGQVTQAIEQTAWQTQQAHQQEDQIRRQAAEIADLHHAASAHRDREQSLLSECAELRDDLKTRLEAQAKTAQAVRYTLYERIPPAILGEAPPPPATGIDDELAELLEQTLTAVRDRADDQQSMRSAVVALSRRVQASAHRIQEEAALMADRHPGNADVLEVSMRVDHAAAQQARTAQSLAVLLGEWPGQQWLDPLPLVDVVRAAAGRIVAYRRVEVAGDQEIAASASIVEPLIHLVAELLANATQSSPPTTQVPVAIRVVQRGAVIEIHDCGVGLDENRLSQARAVAAGDRPIGLEDIGEFAQTGLAVVGQYVRRHGFRVDISESVYGGVRAVVGIPAELTETVEPAEMTTGPAPALATPAVPGAWAEAPPVSEAWAGQETGTAATATATGEVTSQGRLPRRVSPRHGDRAATVPDAGPAEAEPGHDAVPGHTASDSEGPQTTPEEAGAWMAAFLNKPAPDGDSTEQQEQS